MDPTFDTLKDLSLGIQQVEGFPGVIAALQKGRAATIDGAWNSSAALAAGALGLQAPHTLLIVLAHPRDLDAWSEDLVSFVGLRPAVFPAWDAWPIGDKVIDEVAGQRLRLLRQLEAEPPRFIVTTLQALLQPVPDPAQVRQRRRRLRVGDSAALEDLTTWLVEHGFQRMEAVELPGEFSRRGGILDVFSPDAENPYRVEYFGDDIESLRVFAVDTQRSLGDVEAIEITAAGGNRDLQTGRRDSDTGHFFDYLPQGAWVALVEPDDLHEQGKHYLERVSDIAGLFSIPGVFQQVLRFPSIRLTALPTTSEETTCHLRVESVERFSGEVSKIQGELDAAAATDRVLIACHNEAERKRLGEVFAAGQLAQTGRLQLVLGRVHKGFRLIVGSGGGGGGGGGDCWYWGAASLPTAHYSCAER
jgi:transcription-repair coupling factor (superfamily II helicase)